MLDFKAPVIEDKQWVDECFKDVMSLNCEYTFGNIYVWAVPYCTKICKYDGFMICRWGRGEDLMYSLPIGKGDFKSAVNEIILDAKANGIKPVIYGVTPYYKALLDEYFEGSFAYSCDSANSDYIYSTQKLATLTGKKYHSKRNHINNFKKNYPDWSFEVLDKDNIKECIDLHTKWIGEHEDDSDYSLEFEAVLTAFENYEKLGFVGGLIRINGEVIAYTMGERHSDRLFVSHFEKAPPDIQGAYTIINQQFAQNCLMDYELVNREEDLGIEGLRKSKQSYYPEILLEKCVAVYND